MILLLSSLASGATTFTIGTNQDYASVSAALIAEGSTASQPIEFLLYPDYNESYEISTNGYPMGLAFSVDVIIRSSDPGESRVFREVHAYNGANVTLVDLDITPVSASYNDPMERGSGGTIHHAAMLATEGSSLTAERVSVTGQTSSGLAWATDSDLTLIECAFVGNTPESGNASPYEFKNYAVALRSAESGQTLTLVDTEIENTSGPAIAVYSDSGSQSLNITGGRIANVGGESAGSAALTFGEVDTTVSGLSIENAGNTAVQLGAGQHDWRKLDIVEAKGAQGGAFHLADGGNLALNEVVCTECYAEQGGGLVYARGGTSVKVTDLDMISGGGRDGGALFAEGVALYVERGRFCGVANDNGPLISTSSEIRVTNSVFRNMPVNAPLFGGQGGDLFLINNTFVDNAGPILGGIFTGLEFVNNAVVTGTSLNVGEAPIDLTFSYNLFFDNVETNFGLGIQAGEGNQINVEPGFASVFLDDPRNCEIDPVPANGSALIDAGDPSIADKDGTISDIGAFGGPNADDAELGWSPADPTELTLMGGCSGGGGLAGFLLALPLLGLNRKRREWAKQEQG